MEHPVSVAGELHPYGIDAHSIAGIQVVPTACDVYEVRRQHRVARQLPVPLAAEEDE